MHEIAFWNFSAKALILYLGGFFFFFPLLIAFPLLDFKSTICKINKNTAFPKKEKSSRGLPESVSGKILVTLNYLYSTSGDFSERHIKIGFPSPRKFQHVMSVTAGVKATIICQLCFLFKESIFSGWHIAVEKKDTYKNLFSFSIIFGDVELVTSP